MHGGPGAKEAQRESPPGASASRRVLALLEAYSERCDSRAGINSSIFSKPLVEMLVVSCIDDYTYTTQDRPAGKFPGPLDHF